MNKKGTISSPHRIADIDGDYKFSSIQFALAFMKEKGEVGRQFLVEEDGIGKLYLYQGEDSYKELGTKEDIDKKLNIPNELELNRVVQGNGRTLAPIEVNTFGSSNIVGSSIDSAISSLKIPNVFTLGNMQELDRKDSYGYSFDGYYANRIWYVKDKIVTSCYSNYGVNSYFAIYDVNTMALDRWVDIRTKLNITETSGSDYMKNIMSDIDPDNFRIFFAGGILGLREEYRAIFYYDYDTDTINEIPGSRDIVASESDTGRKTIKYDRFRKILTVNLRVINPTTGGNSNITVEYDVRDINNIKEVEPFTFFASLTYYDDNVAYTKDGMFMAYNNYVYYYALRRDNKATVKSHLIHDIVSGETNMSTINITNSGSLIACSCSTGDIYEIYPSTTKAARKLGTLPEKPSRLSKPAIDKNNNVYISSASGKNIYKFRLDNEPADIKLVYSGINALTMSDHIGNMVTDGTYIYFQCNIKNPQSLRRLEPIGDNKVISINNKEEIELVEDVVTEEYIDSKLRNKVDVEEGKGLSTMDFNPDGKTIIIEDGFAKAVGGEATTIPTASTTVKGGAKLGNTLKITDEVLDVNIDEDTLYLENGKLKAKQSSSSSGGSNIVEYVHSGNKEVVVSSIDYTTNTFTSNAHGLVNGDRVAFNKTIDCNILTQTPFSNGWNIDNSGGGWFVVNSTTNTFQLSLTNNGSPIALTERATNDFSKWKIEVQPTVNSIAVNNLNATSLEIEIVGPTFRNTRYLLNNQSIYSGYRVRDNSSDTGIGASVLSDNYNIFTNHLIKVNVSNGVEFIESICNSTKLVDSKITLTKDTVYTQPIRNTPITNIPSLSFNNLKPMNGTKIIIQKIK